MKLHCSLLSLAAVFSLGLSSCHNLSASAKPQSQDSSSVAQKSDRSIQTPPNGNSSHSVEVAENSVQTQPNEASNRSVEADKVSPNVGTVLGEIPLDQGGLSAEQQAKLKALGIAIAVPSVVPADYTVHKVETEPCAANEPRSDKGVCRFGPQYAIVYRNAKTDRCFAIEATGGGVGGVPAEYEVQINTELLGETSLLFGQQNGAFKTPSAQQLNSDQPNLLTDWAGEGPFYRISGADTVRQLYDKGASSQCRNTIAPAQAIQFVQSLTWLK